MQRESRKWRAEPIVSASPSPRLNCHIVSYNYPRETFYTRLYLHTLLQIYLAIRTKLLECHSSGKLRSQLSRIARQLRPPVNGEWWSMGAHISTAGHESASETIVLVTKWFTVRASLRLASPLWHSPLIVSTFNPPDTWQKTHYDGSSPPKSSRSLHKPPIWIQWTQSQLPKHQKTLTLDNKHYTDSSNKNPSNYHLSDHPAQHLHLVPMRLRSLRRTSCVARRLIKWALETARAKATAPDPIRWVLMWTWTWIWIWMAETVVMGLTRHQELGGRSDLDVTWLYGSFFTTMRWCLYQERVPLPLHLFRDTYWAIWARCYWLIILLCFSSFLERN